MKTLVGIANAERVLNNPRAPRPRRTAQNRIRGLKSTEPGAVLSFDTDIKAEVQSILP